MSIYFKLVYKLSNDVTRIFDEDFVERNKNRSRIIFNNKEYPLKEYFEEIYKNYKPAEKITIILKCFHNTLDFGGMFLDCENLLSMSEYSKVDKEQYISVQKSDESLYNLIAKVSNKKEKEYVKIIDTKYMFIGCKSLVSIPDKAEWIKKSFRYIDDINDIFFGCNSLRSVRCRAISNTENILLEFIKYKLRLLIDEKKKNLFFYFFNIMCF